jgi:hypothetical protein
MDVYAILLTLHNATAGLTLLGTLVAAGVLFFTAQTTGTWSALILRATLIFASLQAVLGILMLVIGQNFAYWFHYLLGLIAVGVISAAVARARRAPDREARRYGGILLGVFVLVLVAFLAGQFRAAIV